MKSDGLRLLNELVFDTPADPLVTDGGSRLFMELMELVSAATAAKIQYSDWVIRRRAALAHRRAKTAGF
jgi:hypothetical protein